MIITDIDHIEEYTKALGKNFQTAVNEIFKKSCETLESGKHIIDGDSVQCMVNRYNTKPYAEAQYESHKRYADLQFMVSGREYIYCQKAKNLVKDGDYIPDKDKLPYANGKESVTLDFKPGDIAIFFPEDAHKVGCIFGSTSTSVEKLVFKILL